MLGRTVTIKVRFADFTTITRCRTLRDPTDVSRDIYATARSLFDALGLQRARIRLVGVRMEGLVDTEGAPIQGTARRARPRLARRRPGRRPRQCAVRCRERASRRPDQRQGPPTQTHGTSRRYPPSGPVTGQ